MKMYTSVVQAILEIPELLPVKGNSHLFSRDNLDSIRDSINNVCDKIDCKYSHKCSSNCKVTYQFILSQYKLLREFALKTFDFTELWDETLAEVLEEMINKADQTSV